MLYRDGRSVQISDHVRHGRAEAMVEKFIVGAEVQAWGLQSVGVLLQCKECGRVFIEPGDSDWEDVILLHRELPLL